MMKTLPFEILPSITILKNGSLAGKVQRIIIVKFGDSDLISNID